MSVQSSDTILKRTALLGISIPLSGFVMPASGSQTVTAIVTTLLGVVAADITPGAAVLGSGSQLLTISGTATQVALKLATLTYSSALAGTDRLSVALVTSDGTMLPVAQELLTVLPLVEPSAAAESLVYVDHGTLTIESRTLAGPDLTLEEPAGSANATTLILVNATIDVGSRLTIHNDNKSVVTLPRLAIAGRVELDGSTTLSGNGVAVSVAIGAQLLNEGSMAIGGHGSRFTGGGTFVNGGSIRIGGDGATSAPIRIDVALDGSGVVSLDGGAAVEFGASVAPGQTIRLDGGANSLHLAQPGAFAGLIAGFSGGDRLVLDGMSATGVIYSRTSENGDGILTVFKGPLVVAKIHVQAPPPGTEFKLGTDAGGSTTLSLARTAPGTVDVFRFFDTAHGTQLLTQDSTERDTILNTRPDLRYEGVGLHAVDPAQSNPAAVEVYRFFDVTSGTHFLTSSVDERDAVSSSRPDLVFEPGSTMFEHATAQAGDAAVYRFFDRTGGGHFYTADAGERATILSTRPDMTLEGVAFYAPTT